MKIFTKIVLIVTTLFVYSSFVNAADSTLSMNDLLKKVKAGRIADNRDNQRREQEFIKQKQQQERLIAQVKAQIASLEAKSSEMEAQFNANELIVEEKKKAKRPSFGIFKRAFWAFDINSWRVKGTFCQFFDDYTVSKSD